MKELRIAIVCDGINNFIGGLFISALRFSERLSKNGHNVIIISSRCSDTPALDEYGGMKIYRLSSFPVQKSITKVSRIYLAYPDSKKLKEILLLEKINLVHFMVPTPLAYSSITAARDLGIKVVAHSHIPLESISSYFPELFKKTGAGKYLIDLLCTCIVRLYDKSDAVICPSELSENIVNRTSFDNFDIIG